MRRFRALLVSQAAFRAVAAGPASAEIVLYDAIGAHGITAAAFRDALQKVSGAREIRLRINSPGGEVFDGLAIHNMVARHPAKVTVTIDGLAASIASLIAMAGDTVQMPTNAMMLVHNPSGMVCANSADMPCMAHVLDKIRDRMVNTYAAKTGLDPQRLMALLDAETWMTAGEAKELGFADEVVAPAQVTAQFNISQFKTQPRVRSSVCA
jgi:ATP-dependent Clp protease protease subunit